MNRVYKTKEYLFCIVDWTFYVQFDHVSFILKKQTNTNDLYLRAEMKRASAN